MSLAAALILLDALICAGICARLIFYRRHGALFRPVAGIVAYLIVVAAGSVALLAFLGRLPPPTPGSVLLHAVLFAALWASRGNVVAIFHTTDYDNCLHRWLKRARHDHRTTPQG